MKNFQVSPSSWAIISNVGAVERGPRGRLWFDRALLAEEGDSFLGHLDPLDMRKINEAIVNLSCSQR